MFVASSPAQQRNAGCLEEGHIDPKANCFSRECGFLHNKELMAGAGTARLTDRKTQADSRTEGRTGTRQGGRAVRGTWRDAMAERLAKSESS